MHCPIDRSPLRPIEYEGCLVHTCDVCGGEAVGADALARIVNIREKVFGPRVHEIVGAHAPIPGEPSGHERRSLRCPFCDSGMGSVNYGTDTGILADRCFACGCLWLDREELEMVQTLMERWQDEAPRHIRRIADELEEARGRAERRAAGAFQGSRFTFINAIINRVLDAA